MQRKGRLMRWAALMEAVGGSIGGQPKWMQVGLVSRRSEQQHWGLVSPDGGVCVGDDVDLCQIALPLYLYFFLYLHC
jgi:hypothetical protein